MIKLIWKIITSTRQSIKEYEAAISAMDGFREVDIVKDKDVLCERLKDLTDEEQILALIHNFSNTH